MSDSPLLPQQEDLLRRLVEAHNRLLPDREPFHYLRNHTVAADLAILMHRGRPEPPVYMGDLEALDEEGYIRRRLLGRPGRGWQFELKPKAFDYYESLQHPVDENSKTTTALKPEPGEPTRPSPILILDEIRDGRIRESRLARIVGKGRFDGVDHKVGSRQLFFICLLFQSTRTHRVGGELMTVVSQDEASKKLLEWSGSGFLELQGPDRENPKYRVRKMWGEFVRQMDKVDKLEGIFESKLTDDQGSKLLGLRLAHNETQILVPDISALFRS